MKCNILMYLNQFVTIWTYLFVPTSTESLNHTKVSRLWPNWRSFIVVKNNHKSKWKSPSWISWAKQHYISLNKHVYCQFWSENILTYKYWSIKKINSLGVSQVNQKSCKKWKQKKKKMLTLSKKIFFD